ncbi:hypothetical protein PHAVU_009G251100 [Phaseolus vulgaris]|uniref:Uncharacterized protein n=1 Tax=Phaseolus vulgaris TaxID=3885 RepID=V7B3A4_PHAVU|nr:hypothetical protein PHAVU_009G251100g [Phaseolus vulgaris]ESW10936.1 hypothetical protein PHAVU_009G251100g [Phaseolus vulgaris]
MASSQEHLRKIALEDFDLVEKLYGRRSTSSDAFSGRREGFWVVHQIPYEEMEKPSLKTKEVANYPRAKFQNRWNRPIVF